MPIEDILKLFCHHPAVVRLTQLLSHSDPKEIKVGGLHGSAPALAFAALRQSFRQDTPRPTLIVLNDADEAGYFYHDLTQLLGDDDVHFLPSSFKHSENTSQTDAANQMLRADSITMIAQSTTSPIVVTHPFAMAEMVTTRQHLDERTITLSPNQHIDPMDILERLMDLGFRQVDYVYEPGEVALRGGIMDVFSFASEWPYRLDFFGDQLENIRTFDVETQLSREHKSQAIILPQLSPETAQAQTLLDFLPAETLLILQNPTFLCDEVTRYATSISDSPLPFTDGETFRRQLRTFRRIHFMPGSEDQADVLFRTHEQPLFHKNFDMVIARFSEARSSGHKLYLLSDNPKQAERLDSIFGDRGADLPFTPVNRTLHAGFSDDDLKVTLYTDHQIFDRFHKYNLRSERIRSAKVSLTLKELQQFEFGDYVVHIDHGVGQFAGLVTIPVGDRTQEVIKIIYKNNDTVFVPIHALHKVSKYKGREGVPPRINSLGSGAWERLKERTKTKIKDIARDLIRLYSQRASERGFAFSRDSFMQQELEASFAYEDTPDQMKATADVKADMERPRPMDRLICGDVGFGKTEIAIRAAFKACADDKQVALLVPTTVLAYQHYRTFTQRLRGFPVRIEYLSRARTPAETREVLKELQDGTVNIVIGTHKLIGKSVRFHDLGLLIIDEEQKFGVATKEKLRQLRTNIDTLTLTATPIPRTLQFSLMGARDLSIIQTPPPNRRPIQTTLCQPSAQLIAQAISYELSRDGQVFFVAPRISQLADLEQLIRKHVPQARVAVGHGQMNPETLEEIMLGFAHHDTDVLLSTSIIENGLDIPNANTILVSDAHQFGLSDLHQMRGRVGRSHRKAFCYLLAPPLSMLPSDARRRLQAIENYSDLGSGIHIAMQDLDIRGAGNLLGAEQSGFIADLGYETYKKILDEAVTELRTTEFTDLFPETPAADTTFVPDCIVETDLHLSLPATYVPTDSERMLLYRELDGLDTDDQLERFIRRLQDRFGPLPPETLELTGVPTLRRLGRNFGTERLQLKSGRMRLIFVTDPQNPFYQSHAFDQLIAFATTNAHRCRLEERNGHRSMLVEQVTSVRQALQLLQQVAQIS